MGNLQAIEGKHEAGQGQSAPLDGELDPSGQHNPTATQDDWQEEVGE